MPATTVSAAADDVGFSFRPDQICTSMTATMSSAATSICTVSSGPLVATRRCLAALARHTRRFELIVVADGSRDRLGDYLAGIADVAPFPVTILSHAAKAPLPAVLTQAA